jgi:methyl-accepting chemotaxis protein
MIRGGDLRETIKVARKGDHEKVKDAINTVHDWLREFVAYITKIANGDLVATTAKASNNG